MVGGGTFTVVALNMTIVSDLSTEQTRYVCKLKFRGRADVRGQESVSLQSLYHQVPGRSYRASNRCASPATFAMAAIPDLWLAHIIVLSGPFSAPRNTAFQ